MDIRYTEWITLSFNFQRYSNLFKNLLNVVTGRGTNINEKRIITRFPYIILCPPFAPLLHFYPATQFPLVVWLGVMLLNHLQMRWPHNPFIISVAYNDKSEKQYYSCVYIVYIIAGHSFHAAKSGPQAHNFMNHSLHVCEGKFCFNI